jgi:hypothetical protein
VISAGIAGGLARDIAVGDVVVCRQVDHESHRSLDVDASVYSDEALVREAAALGRELGLTVWEGDSLTVDEVAWTAAEKERHYAWKSHAIVEMESYWIGEAAVAAGVPFLAVRTVSDAAGHEITRMADPLVRADGSFDMEAYSAYLREHPEAGAGLAGQAERTRLAMTSLSTLIASLTARFSSTGAEMLPESTI